MISFICAIPQEPDDKAFMLSLYDSYYKLMYSIAYKYVSDIQTVDDIVQDSIVSLYGKIDILKPMPDKVLAGYIVSTVRNTAINRLRVKEYEKDHIAEFTEENVSGADRYVPMETLLILAERRSAITGKVSITGVCRCRGETALRQGLERVSAKKDLQPGKGAIAKRTLFSTRIKNKNIRRIYESE